MKCPDCGRELKETEGVTYGGKHAYYCIVCGYKGWLYKYDQSYTVNCSKVMKRNEAPKKIYIGIVPSDLGSYKYTTVNKDFPNAVEYTRTDAFIEKACKFLKDKGSAYITIIDGQLILRKGVINDFRKYIKGE